ncbi:hypothetical protein MMPV_002655 [Pyropia vietnamensis]
MTAFHGHVVMGVGDTGVPSDRDVAGGSTRSLHLGLALCHDGDAAALRTLAVPTVNGRESYRACLGKRGGSVARVPVGGGAPRWASFARACRAPFPTERVMWPPPRSLWQTHPVAVAGRRHGASDYFSSVRMCLSVTAHAGRRA